ncbi:MAG: transglycosylase SLT domain-containing protein [Pseudonocardiaceae bacterium]
MLVRAVAVVVLAAIALVGCGGDQRSASDSPGGALAADPVLAPALAGEPPQPSADPPALARQLTVAETTVRDPAELPERVAAAGWAAQVAYDALIDRPHWDAAVLAEVPAPLQDTVRRNVAAGRELRALTTRAPPTTVPAWRIVAPLAAPQLRAYYAEAQQRFGVPWSVLAAVHLVETRMGRIVGLSSAGAQGPMQFLAGTWERYGLGGDVWNTRDAILGAANYLAATGAAEGTDTGLDKALYAYNNSAHYVRAVRHHAALMQADERAYLGFHAWQVYYRTHLGKILLPTGYESSRSMPVEEYLASQPR